MLHLPIHIAAADGKIRSAILAKNVQTTPVVVRGIMGRLLNASVAHSQRGPRGDWCVARNLVPTPSRDTYVAPHQAEPVQMRADDQASSAEASHGVCGRQQSSLVAFGLRLRRRTSAQSVRGYLEWTLDHDGQHYRACEGPTPLARPTRRTM
jgi:hypothetical protein